MSSSSSEAEDDFTINERIKFYESHTSSRNFRPKYFHIEDDMRQNPIEKVTNLYQSIDFIRTTDLKRPPRLFQSKSYLSNERERGIITNRRSLDPQTKLQSYPEAKAIRSEGDIITNAFGKKDKMEKSIEGISSSYVEEEENSQTTNLDQSGIETVLENFVDGEMEFQQYSQMVNSFRKDFEDKRDSKTGNKVTERSGSTISDKFLMGFTVENFGETSIGECQNPREKSNYSTRNTNDNTTAPEELEYNRDSVNLNDEFEIDDHGNVVYKQSSVGTRTSMQSQKSSSQKKWKDWSRSDTPKKNPENDDLFNFFNLPSYFLNNDSTDFGDNDFLEADDENYIIEAFNDDNRELMYLYLRISSSPQKLRLSHTSVQNSGRETFLEVVAESLKKLNNREILSYVIKELKRTERKFVIDLQTLLQEIVPIIEANASYQQNHSAIIGLIPEILEKQIELCRDLEFCSSIDSVADVYLNHKEIFDLYIKDAKLKTEQVIRLAFSGEDKVGEDFYTKMTDHLFPIKNLFLRIFTLCEKVGIDKTVVKEISDLVHSTLFQLDHLIAVGEIVGPQVDLSEQGNVVLRGCFAVKHNKNNPYEATVFLFERSIVFTERVKVTKDLSGYQYRSHIPLLNLSVEQKIEHHRFTICYIERKKKSNFHRIMVKDINHGDIYQWSEKIQDQIITLLKDVKK